jgi:hypothetical protein
VTTTLIFFPFMCLRFGTGERFSFSDRFDHNRIARLQTGLDVPGVHCEVLPEYDSIQLLGVTVSGEGCGSEERRRQVSTRVRQSGSP